MKKIIRLTESDLHRIVKRNVKRILEAHGQGLSYSTVYSAFDKMYSLGQFDRADRLAQTYSDVNDDEDAHYDMSRDTLSIPSEYGPDTQYTGRHQTGNKRNLYRARLDLNNDGDTPLQDPENKENGINKHFIGRDSRTNSAARAKRRANHMNNFYGKQAFDKNNFRA